jgi:hypothetical protein
MFSIDFGFARSEDNLLQPPAIAVSGSLGLIPVTAWVSISVTLSYPKSGPALEASVAADGDHFD